MENSYDQLRLRFSKHLKYPNEPSRLRFLRQGAECRIRPIPAIPELNNELVVIIHISR